MRDHPALEIVEDRYEARASFRQRVLDPRRNFRIGFACDETVGLERAQLPRHDLGRDPLEFAHELAESKRSALQGDDQENFPLVRNRRDGAINGASKLRHVAHGP